MIIVRAPLRISFVGGGTDLPDFYHQYPGRVISTTIDKFIYLAINPIYSSTKTIVKYSILETVNHPSELKHDRFRTALLDMKIEKGIEIGTYADIASKTGLGSSSSFSVALMKGLNAYIGKTISRTEAAEAASHLEIDLLKEPIGKQDQYAAAYGGFNIYQFNADNSVTIEPLLLDFKKRADLEDHMLLFYTGITRDAGTVLGEQRAVIEKNFETYKQMSDSVYTFRDLVLKGDIKGLSAMLHEGWLRKKSLASGISNALIDTLYEAGMTNGAWGGKILGAGGGGCLLFIAPPDRHAAITSVLKNLTAAQALNEAQEIAFQCTQSGTDVLFNTNWHNPNSI